MKKMLPLFLLFFTASLFSQSKNLVALQPLGKVDSRIVAEVKNGIERVYDVKVVVLKTRELPARAYYKPRKRYRAEILLEYLDKNTGDKYIRVLGITERDISTRKGSIRDWGIFGLGSVGGRPAVVSTFRLRRGKVSYSYFINRVVKVVNHELGHTFGLLHCPVRDCLMEDAKGTIKTVDRESGEFCSECRKSLKKILK